MDKKDKKAKEEDKNIKKNDKLNHLVKTYRNKAFKHKLTKLLLRKIIKH
tara:strand:+ start:253 stop:399 length:147 start_codon:yes stop_codon:yes gene_type:complete